MAIAGVHDVARATAAERSARASSVAQVLRLTSRLLGGSEVEVEFAQRGPAPAWTDGRIITINGGEHPVSQNLDDGWDSSGIYVVTALNYHELAHVLFTPRMSSAPAVHARDNGKWPSFNILEDQRAESMFTALYRPSRHYFTKLVTEFLRRTPQQREGNYALVAGRTFLPRDLRAAFRKEFSRPELITDLEDIVHEYRKLDLPTRNDRAIELIDAFHDLLTDLNDGNAQTGGGGQLVPQGDHEPSTGRTAPVAEQRDLAEKQDEEDLTDDPQKGAGAAEDDEDGDESGGQGTGPGGDETAEDDAEEGDEGFGGGDADQDDTLERSDGDGDADSDDDEPGDGDAERTHKSARPGGGAADPDEHTEGFGNDEDDIWDTVDRAAEEAAKEVETEVKSKLDSARHQESHVDAQETKADSNQCIKRLPPRSDLVLSARRVEREWKRMAEALEAGWVNETRSGRFNVLRTMRSERTGNTRVFDRWEDGADNLTDAEVVILVDQSSSMGWHGNNKWHSQLSPQQDIAKASEAAWVLRRAIVKTGGRCTVLGFSDPKGLNYYGYGSRSSGYTVLERGDDPLTNDVRYFRCSGSTYVATAFDEASVVLGSSRRRNKVVVIATDGGFADEGDFQERLDATDWNVVLVGIGAGGTPVEKWASHPAVVTAKVVEDASGLVPVVKDAVKTMMRQAARKGQ